LSNTQEMSPTSSPELVKLHEIRYVILNMVDDILIKLSVEFYMEPGVDLCREAISLILRYFEACLELSCHALEKLKDFLAMNGGYEWFERMQDEAREVLSRMKRGPATLTSLGLERVVKLGLSLEGLPETLQTSAEQWSPQVEEEDLRARFATAFSQGAPAARAHGRATPAPTRDRAGGPSAPSLRPSVRARPLLRAGGRPEAAGPPRAGRSTVGRRGARGQRRRAERSTGTQLGRARTRARARAHAHRRREAKSRRVLRGGPARSL